MNTEEIKMKCGHGSKNLFDSYFCLISKIVILQTGPNVITFQSRIKESIENITVTDQAQWSKIPKK